MSKTAIVFGALLIALGLGGYFAGETRSWTAVIPAIFGLVILGLGITALWEAYRASAMHAAVIVGLLGFFATATSLVDLVRMLSDQRALLAKATMALLCALFVALSVKSFIDARRSHRRSVENRS